MSKLTKQDIIQKINDLIEPQGEDLPEFPKLLKLLANYRQPYMPPRPVGDVQPSGTPTLENIAASMETPEQPLSKKDPFIRRR